MEKSYFTANAHMNQKHYIQTTCPLDIPYFKRFRVKRETTVIINT